MMTSHSRDLRDAALYYSELGYPVFPCVPGQKQPLTPNGFKDATTDADTIEGWWAQYPMANVAIATEGLLVVDVDGSENGWPYDKDKELEISGAPAAMTPRGGSHYVFKQPLDGGPWRNTAGKLGPNVDTRADGGYILVEPSVVDGKRYAWVESRELDSGLWALSAPPDWIVRSLEVKAPLALQTAQENPAPAGDAIPSGQRNSTLIRFAGALRRYGLSKDELLPSLLALNESRCSPPLPRSEVSRIAENAAKYEPDQISVAVVENHWEMDQASTVYATDDPGVIPESLLTIPGFVSELMDYTLDVAPYPNVALAFCGALALLSTLTGRKVRDPGNIRPNLYILGLALSGAGKDKPRKVNIEIMHQIGCGSRLGDSFASGEGLQDALLAEPCMLFQTDEIDGMIRSVSHAKDARFESIMNNMLRLYSASDSVFTMRRKAGQTDGAKIVNPSLTLFGTAIPNHYYQALSERMLTNGFFSRLLIIECGKRAPGQEPKIAPIPQRILEAASAWSNYSPGGNLAQVNPEPHTVQFSPRAARLITEARIESELEYAKCEASGDNVGTAVWTRVPEQLRKLALLYALSQDGVNAIIDDDAVAWARAIAWHQVRRMLFMASQHVAENPFEAECLKLSNALREAPGFSMTHSALLRKMRMNSKQFMELIATMLERGQVQLHEESTSGRARKCYRLPVAHVN